MRQKKLLDGKLQNYNEKNYHISSLNLKNRLLILELMLMVSVSR